MCINSRPEINWEYISTAISFYKNQGYQYIEVPYYVNKDYSDITCPKFEFDKFILSNNNILIGSAEQAFLELALMNNLEKNKLYVSLSPCFRNEPVLDNIHYESFMKIELFYFNNNEKEIRNVFKKFQIDAYNLFYIFLKRNDLENKLKIWSIDKNNIDIEFNNIEIGSYNIKKINTQNFNWVCGTGLAEPRFSNIIKLNNNR